MAAPNELIEELPGTHRLFDINGNIPPGEEGLQKHGNIVLVPQPTDSPNDPLHWPLARKRWHTFLVCFVTALTAATSNDAGSGADGENEELDISYNVFNTGAGVLFIGIGYWTLLSSPAVHLYGRRILYLVCMLLGIAGCIWYGRGQTASDAIWSQLFVGASEAVAEATVQLSLMDLWFQHQRGAVLGLYVLSTGIGTYLGPLVASYIADTIGWRWIGYLGAIANGFTFVLFYFGLEETAFQRDHYVINKGSSYKIDGRQTRTRSEDTLTRSEPSKEECDKEEEDQANPNLNPSRQIARYTNNEQREPNQIEKAIPCVEKPKSYFQRITLITPASNLRGTGFKQYFQRLFHTLRVFSFPAVLFAGLQWGAQNAWLTFYLTVEESVYYDSPYNYSDAAVGNMEIPCLIGVIIGCTYGGWFSDKFLIWMTHRNNGIMEAEMRLWLMIPCACIFPTGILLFGIGSAQGWNWPVPYVSLGFIGFGYGCAGDLSMAYLADAYPEMILEGMVGTAVINNTIGMIFSFVASDWLDEDGTQTTFIVIGVLAFVFMMTTLPMIWFGKKARRWTLGRYLRFLEIRDGM